MPVDFSLSFEGLNFYVSLLGLPFVEVMVMENREEKRIVVRNPTRKGIYMV